jgi:hypothetical protein
VCGFDFWRVIVTSPEVLIFLFFMITDPKTVPAGSVGRVVFGLLVGVASTLLLAPQTTEFGAKVGLIAGLVVISAARPILDRVLPEPRSAADDLGQFVRRVATGSEARAGSAQVVARAGLIGVVLLVTGVGIVAAGTPARGLPAPDTVGILDRVPHEIDPATLPTITVGQDVADFDHQMVEGGADELVVTLAENLELETEALLRWDETILAAVDHGDRLVEMQDRLSNAIATGSTTISRYQIDTVAISLVVPFGVQSGLSMGLDSRGTVTEETYDAAGTLLSAQTSPFELRFVMRRATGDRWLNVAVLPFGS